MFCHLLVLTLAVSQDKPKRLNFKPDGTLKMLHVSDTHYDIPERACRNIDPSPYPCGHTNTTDFIRRLIALEKPDLVVFTGDIVDGDTHPSETGMSELYGCAIDAGLPWAATIGNHDPQSNLNRSQIMDVILSLNLTLSQLGPAMTTHTYGNFILEFFADATATQPLMRSYHFDSDTQDESINDAQVEWFKQVSADSQIPSIAFYHIPLVQYEIALNESLPISGSINEAISYQPVDSGIFEAFKAASVKAGFCGHDHVNDFCVLFEGMQLCYEGCPGYQAYGQDGYKRRARVTELREWGQQIVSWKRVDDVPATTIDYEVLWSADESLLQRSLTNRVPIPPGKYQKLPHFEQDIEFTRRSSERNVLDPRL